MSRRLPSQARLAILYRKTTHRIRLGHLQQLALRRVTANGRVHEPDARLVFECNVNTKEQMDTSTCTMHTLSSVHNPGATGVRSRVRRT